VSSKRRRSVEVIYERDPNVGNGFQAYRGRLQWQGGVHEFQGMHFEGLLRLLHDIMEPEDHSILFIRSDRPGAQPYRLDDELTSLIKSDVELAIQKMNVPDVHVVLGRPPPSPAVLRSCSDTLAGAFGEWVLLRRRGGKAECPICGRWVDIAGGNGTGPWLLKCACSAGGIPIGGLPDEEWVGVRVPHLLACPSDKFFLPREWNGYRPWISREDLQKKYDEFLKDEDTYNAH